MGVSSHHKGPPNRDKYAALILRSGLLAASRRIGHKRPGPSLETPRKRAAPQEEEERVARKDVRIQ
jgi:hypothetical protein